MISMNGFLDNKNATGRDTHDPALDASLGGGGCQGTMQEEYLVKPSGPLNAAMMSLWEYPIYTTLYPEYGH